MSRRVFVTGLGAVSALGHGAGALWQSLLAGAQRVCSIPDAWLEYADFRSRLWSPLELPDYAADGFSRNERAQVDPVSLNAARAADEALRDAQLAPVLESPRSNRFRVPGLDSDRAAVYVGTGVGGVHSFLAHHALQTMERPRRSLESLAADAPEPLAEALRHVAQSLVFPDRFNPFVVSMIMPNAPAAFVAGRYSLHGPALGVSLACAAGTAAVGRAFRDIREGRLDVALAGGSEYLNDAHGGMFRSFDAARALVRWEGAPELANRPFDRQHSGFLFSQGGAGMLVLESESHLESRGGVPYAELAGYGESFDAHSMMAIEAGGQQIERAIRMATDEAALDPAAIDYVNTHGTGTQNNDQTEAEVIARVYAEPAGGDGPLVNSTKSLLGHTVGASGSIEALVCALSLAEGRVHGSNNLVDPIAALDFATTTVDRRLKTAVSHSFAFGGHNAVLLFKAASPSRSRAPEC